MDRMLENANKIAFLVKQEPEATFETIVESLGWPAIEINTAHWYATELGLLKELDQDTGMVALGDEVSGEWNFGPEVERLEDMLVYAFTQLAKREGDLEEHYVQNWLNGYSTLSQKIAIDHLIESKKLSEYMIEDGDSTYTFYTLYENRDKLWGNKQFKVEPGKQSEIVDEPEAPDAESDEPTTTEGE